LSSYGIDRGIQDLINILNFLFSLFCNNGKV
jgi:hypothetical protein